MSSPYVSSIRHRTRRALRACAAALVTAAALLAAPRPADAAGVLRPRDGSPPIAVQSQRVSAVLDDGLARTTLRQTFVSHATRTLEAVYEFPLPENAALVDVAMEVGGQRLEGLLVERQTARRIYDSIVRERRDPALVEQIGREMFRLSVFPVVPDAPTVVELTWIEQIPLVDGRWRYAYPLATPGVAGEVEQDLTFVLDVRSSAPLVALESPLADMGVGLMSLSAGRASLERTRALLHEDLVVEATVRAPQALLATRSYRDVRGTTYAAAVLTPPAAEDAEPTPRDVTLVLDVSGSMQGEKIAQAIAAARFLVAHARPIDRVNVVRFSSTVDAYAAAPVYVTDERRAELLAFVDATRAAGGTALGDALSFALGENVDPTHLRTIVVLTDGRPTVGVTDAAELVRTARDGAGDGARVFTFGVGADVDDGLLRGIAAATAGTAEVFRPGGEIESRVSRFLRRTAVPLLTDLRVETPDGRPVEVFPRPLPDVYLGEQSVLTARFRDAAPDALNVHAKIGGRAVVFRAALPVRDAPGGDADVCRLYGRQRIAFLEETLRLRTGLADAAYYAAVDRGAYDTRDEIVEEIVETSLACGVQSAYASFLVLLPEDRARLDPRNVDELRRARERAAAARRTAGATDDARADTADGGSGADAAATGATASGAARADDPVIKDAKVSDHDETDNDMADEAALGVDFDSDAPFEGAGTNGTIGIGGGAGGAFGGRRGGQRDLRAGGGGRKIQSAVDKGLEYLQLTQHESGAFAQGEDAVGVTGTALLCFLGAGETHNSGDYRDCVRRGLRYLKAQQAEDGWFGSRDRPDSLFNHTRATLAMVEAYGLTGSKLFKDPAQRALDALYRETRYRAFLPEAQRETPWIVLTAHSAHLADLTVEPFRQELAQLARLALRRDAATDALLTDAAHLALVLSGDADATQRALASLAAAPETPSWSDGRADLERMHVRTLLAYQLGGAAWDRWRSGLESDLAGAQRTEEASPARPGSVQQVFWERDPAAAGRGRTADTALCTLMLEVVYRYGRVIGGTRR